MNGVFDEEESHKVCKVCDWANRNEDCPGCGFFAFESFSIKEHDAEIRRQTIEELNKELTELIQGDEEFIDWQKEEILLCLECAIEQMKEVRNDLL